MFRREFAWLREAEQRYRTRGVDVRDYIRFEVTHPFLKEWQAASDDLVRELPGRSDLRRARRRGILRLLDGEEKAMPFDVPPMIWLPPGTWRNGTWRVYRLADELEYLELIFVPSDDIIVRMRPVVDLLSHRQARAILGWRSSLLDYWISTAPQFIGGLRKIAIPPEVRATLDESAVRSGRSIRNPRTTTHRIVFDTLAFLRWLQSNQN